ncbi:hypothetical protein I8752_36565 [Nostocaceae cyanobacterium CENA369]|uniref:Uncharacterized protein n=1 Tax=Dendronalium phyllosphericum CENA369 TaxID=1725256 RepID=A0A8J7IMF8_9NOST|nr:hypothetical protein [Dendronalium phyllosphericum]MBH8578360.1 hypothetical protein [Dendronalium phyllosphericum CENA369]
MTAVRRSLFPTLHLRSKLQCRIQNRGNGIPLWCCGRENLGFPLSATRR